MVDILLIYHQQIISYYATILKNMVKFCVLTLLIFAGPVTFEPYKIIAYAVL